MDYETSIESLNELIKTYREIFETHWAPLLQYGKGDVSLEDYQNVIDETATEESLLELAQTYVRLKVNFENGILRYKVNTLLSMTLTAFPIEEYLSHNGNVERGI